MSSPHTTNRVVAGKETTKTLAPSLLLRHLKSSKFISSYTHSSRSFLSYYLFLVTTFSTLLNFHPFFLFLLLLLNPHHHHHSSSFSSSSCCLVAADFVYADFNETSGLAYNGDAATSSCDAGKPYLYNPLHSTNDAYDEGSQSPMMEETTDISTEQTSMTFERVDATRTSKQYASFPHRDRIGKPPDPLGCSLRLRLTPARPYKVGSVMRIEAAPVLDGFETGFHFQITDHAQICTLVKDRSFGTTSYRTCSIRGGDGFAFVLHADPNASKAIGFGGSGLGYAGIRNAVAIEFDTLYNGGLGSGGGIGTPSGTLNAGVGPIAGGVAPPIVSGSGKQTSSTSPRGGVGSIGAGGDADLPGDHVTIQVSPLTGARIVTQGSETRLGAARAVDIGDGAIHQVRIIYWPYIKYDLTPFFTATPLSAEFLKDAGDGRRIGTLAVYVDNMNLEKPAIVTPINLNVLLQLSENQAFMGFTAATGNAWQKHDITQWYFCEKPGCTYLKGEDVTVV